MQDETTTPAMIGADEAAAQWADRLAQARREVSQTAQAIAEMCLIAGCPDKAAEFIAAGHAEAEVRKALITMKAERQSPEILSTLDPDQVAAAESPTSPHNPLISAVKKLSAKE
jgi:hypothetical protein